MSRPSALAHISPAPFSAGSRRAPAWALSVLVLSGVIYAILFLDAVSSADDELLQALTITPILIGLTIPIALRIARTDRDPTLATIIVAALAFKIIAAYIRFYVAFDVYNGRTDAKQYDEVGEALAPAFRRMDFSFEIGSLVGTGFVKMLTGIVYAIFGTSRISGFFVFAWLGFLGLLLITRAFRMGVPTGNARRYTIAVLFVPTLVYWPSAIGKEAWMMLGLGLTAYGIAAIFQKRSGGYFMFAVGLVAMLLVRPHITLIVFVGLAFALLLRRAPARTYASPMFRVLGLAMLLALGVFLTSQTDAYFDPKLDADSLTGQLAETTVKTTDAGSSFTPVRVNTPIDVVPAFVTVFFRPFPFEVTSAQELATAAEGLLLIGLLFASRKRLRSIPRMMRTTPYVTFCVGYVLAFVYAFSSFANFGILSRQRVQALPFLLVFIALPPFQDLIAQSKPAPDELELIEPPLAVAPAPRRRSRRPPRAPRDRVPVSSGSSFPPPIRAQA